MTARIEYRHGRSPDALADLPDGCAAAVVTDPPYGTASRDGTAHSYGRRAAQVVGRTERPTEIANDADLSSLRETAPVIARMLSPDGVALVFCAPSNRREAENVLIAGGLRPLHVAPWDKGAPGISYRVRYAYEDVIIAVRGAYDPWDIREPLVVPLRVPRVRNPEHPNEKPVALLRRLIAWACPGGGLVVDPWAGVASCGVAAIAERCDYVGVELDPAWWTVAERRLADARHLPHDSIEQPGLALGGAA